MTDDLHDKFQGLYFFSNFGRTWEFKLPRLHAAQSAEPGLILHEQLVDSELTDPT